jgi:AsmA protein
MKRWAKILLALVGLAIAGVASIPFFVNANTFRPTIERQLTTMLGRSVKLGGLTLSLFPAALVAKDLSVGDDPEFSAAPFLTAKGLRIGVSLRPLIFSRQLNLQSFEIESPQINLSRAANGAWNFSSLGRLAAAAAAGMSKDSTTQLADLSVDRIVITDGRAIIATLPAHGRPHVYEHVNLTARGFSFSSLFPFELAANLPAGGTMSVAGHVGPLNRADVATSPADAQVSVKDFDPVNAGFLDPDAGLSLLADVVMRAASDGHTLTTSGKIHIQKLKLRKGAAATQKPLDLTYTGTHRLRENGGQIEDAIARIGNAAIHVSGEYQLDALNPENPLLNLKLGGQNLPINELQSLMTAAAIRLPNGAVLKGGSLSMNFAITGHAKSLVITGPIALDNTQLVGFDIGSKIHGIAALSGLKTGDTADFEKLRANVRITNDGVAVDRIDVVIPAMGELKGSGTVSPADQLDFGLIVKVASAKGMGKIGVGLLTKLNGSNGTPGSTPGVPMRVIGTPEEPYITADVGGIVQKKIRSIASIFGKKK